MLHAGQHSAFPNLNFLGNRIICERLIEAGWKETRAQSKVAGIRRILSDEDLQSLLADEDQGMSTNSDEEIANDEIHPMNLTFSQGSTENGDEQKFEIVPLNKGHRSNSSLSTLISNLIPSWKSSNKKNASRGMQSLGGSHEPSPITKEERRGSTASTAW